MASSLFSSAASLVGSAMFVRSMARDLLPRQFHYWVARIFYRLVSRPSPEMTICIEKYVDWTATVHHMYEAAAIYLDSKTEQSVDNFFKVSKKKDEKGISVQMVSEGLINDRFEGIDLTWKSTTRDGESIRSAGARVFFLTFDHKYMDRVLNSYLPHILRQSKTLKEEKKGLKLHTLERKRWRGLNLDHPSTFHTLAMDPELKIEIMADLDRFIQSRDFYRRVGKAWKRGYLLYGPPGTGKSSLIAAIANYLNFDIYDLELTSIVTTELKDLLVKTANRSILVIEDIDCSIDLEDRRTSKPADTPGETQQICRQEEAKLSLSALLNFIDGLWSTCGDERIIIFTTNYKDRLDPALLRPGRMDMHILMSYCCSKGFRVLAKNYLGLEHHPSFSDIDALIQEVNVTPAEVAEELLRHDEPEMSLSGLVDFLREKRAPPIAVLHEDKATDQVENKREAANGNKSPKNCKRKG